jgi:hypothetical protein
MRRNTGLLLGPGLCLALLLSGLFLPAAGAAQPGGLQASLQIPLKDTQTYGSGYVVGGTPWAERGQITLTARSNLDNVVLSTGFPSLCQAQVPTQSIAEPVRMEGGRLTVTFPHLAAGASRAILFELNTPPVSHQEAAAVSLQLTWVDQYGHSEQSSEQFPLEIRPAPLWWSYAISVVGVLLLLLLLLVTRRSRALLRFSTQDLILIAIMAALGGVVFRWFWQTFNSFLGPFGGLLSTIPEAVLLITALHLVRKPGTATLLLVVEELIASLVWGTNTLAWLGYYLLPGAAVDLLAAGLGPDYADRWWTATLYGLARSFLSYWLFYFFFAPALWKIYYAPWYSWMNILIGCAGGLIGGFLGWRLAQRLQQAAI